MSALKIHYGGYTSQGIKFENQDAFAAWHGEGTQLKDKGAVIAIADGVSACTKAKDASHTAVNTFIYDYIQAPSSWSVKRSVGKILTSLNRWCYGQFDYAQGGGSQMLTTLSCLIFKSTTGFLMHVGDSRIYRYQEGLLEQLSTDHVIKQRSKNILTRAIGLDAKLDVDFASFALRQGEVYLLTTDGVHDFLGAKTLAKKLKDMNNPEQAARDIVDAALDAGSNDNVTCFIAMVEALPEANLNELGVIASEMVIPPPLEVGHKLEGFRVIEQVFNGTRSCLYKVVDETSGQIYGLKAPTVKHGEDADFMQGFLREEWVGRNMDSPYVMKILPRPANTHFIFHVCEYIEGQSLRQWMIDHPAPSLDQVRRIVLQVVKALRAFQRNDMVHRDLKPENIMITEHGEVKLIDFGTVQVSSLLETGEQQQEKYPVGSVHYIAPEFLIHNRSSFKADMFSLGVIVYEMFTGKLPYAPFGYKDYIPASADEYRYQSVRKTRADLPAWLDICLKKITHPEESKRFEAFSDFETALCNPAEIIAGEATKPLIEHNPVLVWQLISAILFVIIVWQSISG